MPYGVTLRRSESVLVNVWAEAAYRVRVDALDPVGFDGRVFVFRRGPTDPYTGTPVDSFVDVVGPSELAEVPPDAPDPARGWPYFRLASVELDVRSTQRAEELWAAVRERVGVLTGALARLEALSLVEEVRVGDPVPV